MEPIKINSLEQKPKYLKESVQQYLDNQLCELATESRLQEIRGKRQEFLDTLHSYGIGYLLDLNFIPKSVFEWKCLEDILSTLAKFDVLTQNPEYMGYIERELMFKRDDRLRRKLGDIYDPKYKDEII